MCTEKVQVYRNVNIFLPSLFGCSCGCTQKYKAVSSLQCIIYFIIIFFTFVVSATQNYNQREKSTKTNENNLIVIYFIFFFLCRDGFFNQLKQLQTYLFGLQNQRENLQSLQANRLLLSKQAALVSEAESLGTALGSHQLNTLTQRYSVYKRTRNEYAACKQSLRDQSSTCTRQKLDYHNCIQSIETNKIAEFLVELNELLPAMQTVSATHAFDIVKEFLDNSAQMAIYLQSCQISSDLDVSLMQQTTVIRKSLETLIEYGAVSRYNPASNHAQHRFAKYSEWCEFLMEHSSVQDCRDVVTQFQASFGKNAINKISIQQVITFSYQLQNNIRDGQLKLSKQLERLNVELNGMPVEGDAATSVVPFKRFEESRNAIRIYLDESTREKAEKRNNVIALQCIITTTLCDLNKRLLMMENAAASSGENMIDLTFNGNWVLDELYTHSAIMCELATIIETAHRDYTGTMLSHEFSNAAQCLREIQCVHETLRTANEQFAQLILNDALHGVISENKSVLDMISTLSNLQEGLQSIPDLITSLNLLLRRKAMSSSRMVSPTIDLSAENAICNDVGILRQKLCCMKQQFEQCTDLEPGQKLFLQFNTLFDKLDDEYQRLIDCLQRLTLNDECQKIDQFKNSMELAVSTLK